MSGEALLVAALGAALVQVLGSSLALLALGGRHRALALAGGLLWGTACYAGIAAAFVLSRYALGEAPLFAAGPVLATTVVAAAALAAALHHRTRGRLVAAQLASAAAVALAAVPATVFDLSPLTPDSVSLVEASLGLARLADPDLVSLSFLGGRGLFGVLLHAPASAAGLDYLWFAHPLLGLSCLATLAVAGWEGIRAEGGRPALAALVVSIGVAWLLGCYFWLYQLFYVHVNLLAGAYLLLFFHAAWMDLRTEEPGWCGLAALALLAFQMLRVEGTLFAAAFVALLVLERAAAGRSRRGEAALVLGGVAWCAVLATVVSDGAILDRGRLLAMGVLLLACLPLGWAARRPSLDGWRERLPGGLVTALALGLALLVAIAPAHMLQRGAVLLDNAFRNGLWSTGWALPLALALAGPLLGRAPRQRFVLLGLAAFFLLLLGLTFAGYWREGWYDSGNRMLTHALPTVVWIVLLRAAAIVPTGGARAVADA